MHMDLMVQGALSKLKPDLTWWLSLQPLVGDVHIRDHTVVVTHRALSVRCTTGKAKHNAHTYRSSH